MGPLEMITEERVRQQTQEGYSLVHDNEHDEGQLALLAAGYALSSRRDAVGGPFTVGLDEVMEELEAYGWDFKPKCAIDDLVRAGALILAELERIMRALNINPQKKM